MPLTIYSADGQIIGVYGEQRREFTKINDFPDILKNAVIAAEDKRFYEHWGVDVWVLLEQRLVISLQEAFNLVQALSLNKLPKTSI